MFLGELERNAAWVFRGELERNVAWVFRGELERNVAWELALCLRELATVARELAM